MSEEQEPLESDQTDIAPRKSWLRRLRPFLLLVAVLALLPSVCTMLQCHQSLLKLVSPKLAEAIEYDHVTTHLWAPLEIRNLTVMEALAESTDDQADHDLSATSEAIELATIRTVKSDQTLWGLMFSQGRGATFHVSEPHLTIRSNGNATNVEQTLAELFGESDSSAESFPVAVIVTDGEIQILNRPDRTDPADVLRIDNLQGTFSSLDSSRTLPELRLSGIMQNAVTTATETRQTSRSVNPRIAANLNDLSADFPLVPFQPDAMAKLESDKDRQSFEISLTNDESVAGLQHLDIQLQQLQLQQIRPFVKRFLPGFQAEGKVSCLIQAHVLQDQGQTGFAGRLQFSGRQIFARHQSWHPMEALRLESVTAGGVIAFAEDGIMVKDLTVSSPVITLSGNGQVQVAAVDPVKALRKAAAKPETRNASTLTDAEALSAGEVTINGRVDVAELTRMLPRTMQLMDDVRINEADIDFSCRVRQQSHEKLSRQLSGAARPGFQWQVAAETSEIRARRGSQRLHITAPVRIDAMGPLNPDSVSFRKGRLAGDFGDVNLDPVENGFAVQGVLNPDRLHETLSQLVTLPSIGLKNNVQVEGTLQWLDDGSIRATAVNLQGDDLLVSSPQLIVRPAAPVLQMLDGELQLKSRTDTLRVLLAPWHDASWLAPGSEVQLVADCEEQQFRVQALVEPLTRGRSHALTHSGNDFQLSHARAKCLLIKSSEQEKYVIQEGQLEMPGLQAEIDGSLQLVGDLVFADLKATTEYDLEVLLNNVLEIDPQLLTLQGQQRQPFQITGCLSAWNQDQLASVLRQVPKEIDADSLKPLSVTGAVTWDTGHVMGLPVSSGIVNGTLTEGLIRTSPVTCSIGTGSLNAMVQCDLQRNVLQLAPGSRLQNLELNEQFTRQWLGYAMPMLGDAAQVRGHLSTQLDQCVYDLNDINQSRITGRLDVHDASATAGSSANSILSVLAVLDKEAAQNFQQLVLPPQTIQLRMQSGQISHDQLLIQAGKYNITSRGVVTTDKRINLALTVPVSQQASRFTGGRTLTIPVTGTVSRPVPNTAGLLQNIGQQQIQNRVNDEIDRGLNKLFDKLR